MMPLFYTYFLAAPLCREGDITYMLYFAFFCAASGPREGNFLCLFSCSNSYSSAFHQALGDSSGQGRHVYFSIYTSACYFFRFHGNFSSYILMHCNPFAVLPPRDASPRGRVTNQYFVCIGLSCSMSHDNPGDFTWNLLLLAPARASSLPSGMFICLLGE